METRNLFRKVILERYPDYDFERYHFRFGDIVTTNTHAKIFVKESSLTEIEGFSLTKGFGIEKHSKVSINYEDLPYYKEGEFVNEEYVFSKRIKWEVGDFVIDPKSEFKLLLTEPSGSGFLGWVIDSNGNKFYDGTGVYVSNPYKDYISPSSKF